MKLKKVELLCKQQKNIVVSENNGSRWLGDGYAMYFVKDMPRMTKDELFSMFDIPEKKRNGYSYVEEHELPEINFEDTDPSEKMLERSEYSILRHKQAFEPLRTSQGISFIALDYLRPFESVEPGYDIYERTSPSGGLYFAIKRGFLLLGIILPLKPNKEALAEWATDLSALL